MPIQSVWMIRLSLIWLLIASGLGALLFIHKTIPLHPSIWSLLPLHYEIAIWGWIVQFVLGTAYWIFPRFLEGEPRGSKFWADSIVWIFNIGLIILLISYLFFGINYLPLIGRGLILMSLFIFIFLIWSRVVSYRNNELKT
ncbi:MAG: cbb3-type cytochrome c oxidase subunit I [Balneolaceae bacterium]